MLTSEQVIDRWRSGNILHRFNEDIVRQLDLPNETRDFLIQVGMPPNHQKLVPATNVYANLPSLADVVGNRIIADECKDFRVFQDYSVSGIVIHFGCLQLGSGQVYGVLRRPYGTMLEPMFSNSSINKLVQFITEFDEYDNWLLRQKVIHGVADRGLLDPDELIGHATETITDLQIIDPNACAEFQNYRNTGKLLSNDGFPQHAWTQVLIRFAKTGYWN